MIKGLYASASAMLNGMNRQTVVSHNIANVNTPGYKTVAVSMEQWEETPVVPNLKQNMYFPNLPSAFDDNSVRSLKWLGDLGLGVETTPEVTNYEQGSLETTGEPLDFAIEGPGFFHILTPDGERYTRDGRFLKDNEGNLVTVDGNFVLDTNGERINLPTGNIEVDNFGRTLVNNEAIAQIGLVEFENTLEDIQRDSSNIFNAIGTPVEAQSTYMHQSTLEMSNVNIAQATTQMLSLGRAYEAAQKMMSVHDGLTETAITYLGRL
ncbi:MAG: flagellar hook-basal body protein [Anaerolineaceae bacterium]|nr:flagellar hook-basal body protein [Anaerolineaceae bacterium]